MQGLFNECNNLKEIKGINSFNTIKVNNMNVLFQGCKSIEYLDLSNFNTFNVSDMEYMFCKCKKLKEIKGIRNFNTKNVIKMGSIFNECFELEYLDLYKFTPILFDYP